MKSNIIIFLLKGTFCDQTKEVAMGSSLAPILANPFMGHHEKTWLNNYLLLKFYSMDFTLTTPFLSFSAGLSRLRVTIEDILTIAIVLQ